MTQFIDTLVGIFQSSGFAQFGQPGGWLYAVMICVGCFLLYLAIVKEFEPLILLPMAFGMILANLPGSGIIHMQYFVGDGLEHPMWIEILNNGGLADMLYMGVKLGIYPPLIFLGIGTMTDFAPLISNPKSLLLGAAAQLGIFLTYVGCRLLGFTGAEASSVGIIGGADGPTAIFVTALLAPALLGLEQLALQLRGLVLGLGGLVQIVFHLAAQILRRMLHGAGHRHPVLLGHLVAGVQQPLGQRTVISQQQQSLGIPVQPPHGVNAGVDACQQVHDGFPSLLVGDRGHIAPGLVQHQVYRLRLLSQRNAVHPDVVRFRVGLLPQLRRLPVDGDSSRRDIILRCSAGADTGGR